jgi:type VI secretion system secreted protein Hcp
MAQTAYLWLEIDGNSIEGESRVRTLGRDDTIECSSFHYGLEIPYDPGSGTPTGRPQPAGARIEKRIDKSTPLLLKALFKNEPVNRAEFRFYRPDRTDPGNEEHYFTVLLEGGFIVGVTHFNEAPIPGGVEARPMLEEVVFVSQTITWTDEIRAVSYGSPRR